MYIVLNKSSGYVTTNEDEFGRKTVFDFLDEKDKRDNLFSVGRLDKDTSGLLILTNDGDFAQSVIHPSKEIAKGSLGATAKIDITVNEIEVKNYDAIIFVGGNGSSEYWENEQAHNIAQEAVKQNKILAAICIAPVTLAKAGVLKDKKATVFESEIEEIKKYGAIYTGKNVEIDENIITANGPQSAKEFGEKILSLINVIKQ